MNQLYEVFYQQTPQQSSVTCVVNSPFPRKIPEITESQKNKKRASAVQLDNNHFQPLCPRNHSLISFFSKSTLYIMQLFHRC